MPNLGYKPARKVFPCEQDKLFANYFVMAGDTYYGLSPTEACELAYQCATRFKVNFPPHWSHSFVKGY